MTTATVGTIQGFNKGEDISVPITISGGAAGGALAATNINVPEAWGMKLDEVEVDYGLSTDKLTIKSGRGTKLFEIAALDATESKVYGGHQTLGIFPRFDSVWTIETDGFTAEDTVTVYLKFTRFNG